MGKLILEALEELDSLEYTPEEKSADLVIDGDAVGLEMTPELSDSDIEILNSGVISDLLTKELDVFNYIKNYLNSSEIDETLRVVLDSVCEDVSLSIGKLQQCLKDSVDEKTEELIYQGEEEAVAEPTDTEIQEKEE